jgi:phthiocerol/phenolphthiocerol synthesis type-I polyketide synthase C
LDGSVKANTEYLAALQPIAIIGAACRLPGATDLNGFAELLAAGRDAVTEIPDGRWTKSAFFHPARDQRGKAYTFAAGVLGAVDGFDAGFFGISPREAAQMDPQQRLLLELAHEALEDAGLDAGRLAGAAVGVYVGGSAWDYTTLHAGDHSVMDAYSMTGATLCSLSNRVSYAFDLRGPSFTVDTACSSSLVALHQACEAIRAGQAPMALVGGVNLLLSPQSYVGFCAASMLSPRGRCHAFDARADGYVRAEGGGMIVLKPLRAALADGDTVHAVVRGTGVNSDGRTNGFSLPNPQAQSALLRAVYGRFGIDPDDLDYVEAHGTGTPAGDPIEAAALGEVLGQRRAQPLPIGSVKTNIGHLEAASGMAGLLKAVLAFRAGRVPGSLHCETPNPAIPFSGLNLALTPDGLCLPGASGGRPAMIGVNSFGFGGTNAHAVLEATPASTPLTSLPLVNPAVVNRAQHEGRIAPILLPASSATSASIATSAALPPLLLSARSNGALRGLATAWRDLLDDGEADAALIRGAALGREQYKLRLAVTGATAAELGAGLRVYLAGQATHTVAADTAVSGRVAFVFSGNGSQWAGMAVGATARSPAFRAALAAVDSALQGPLDWSVQARLAEADAPGTIEAMRDTSVAQPLLFALQVAAVMALRTAGVQPDACMGHSVGEVAAAWAAGALTLDQAARVIAVRSRLQARTAGDGGMAVLGLDAETAAAALAGMGLEVAASNSRGATTVAGPQDALDSLAAEAAERGWAYTALDLDYAFHSRAMDAIQGPLAAELAGLAPSPASLPFVSTVTGGPADGTTLDAAYWWQNVRAPVRFAEAAAHLVTSGVRIFIEVGPQPVLQAYLHDALLAEDAIGRVLPTLSRRAASGDPILLTAGRAHAAGCDIRRAPAFAGPRRLAALPAYPWQRERHWLARTTEAVGAVEMPSEHPLLGIRRGAEPVEWSVHLGTALQPWLADHVVGGAVVAPAAALAEMALAAARARHPGAAALEVLDLEINRPLVFEHGALREVRLRVGTANGGFEIASRPRLSDEPWTVHATGRLGAADAAVPARDAMPAEAAGRTLDGAALYGMAAGLGLAYGPAFQVVSGVEIGRDTALVRFLPHEAASLGAGSFLVPPPVMDGALQGLLALAAGLLGDGDGVLPWRFGRVRLLRPAGVVPAAARLRVTRVGPRSVRADISLLDATGQVAVELLDCWFVRVALSRAATEDRLFHLALVPSLLTPSLLTSSLLTPSLAGAAYETGAILGEDAGEAGEAGILADAFAAVASAGVLRRLLPDPATAFTVGALIEDGVVAATARDRLEEILGWLAADGLAAVQDGAWTVLDDDIAADDVLRTLLFDQPRAVADVALLSLAAERLESVVRGAPATVPAPALLDGMLHGSPAATAAADALLDAMGRLATAWPVGQPLRILEVGARRGAFTRQLLRRLEGLPVQARLDAATGAEDLPALSDALAGQHGVAACLWQPGAGRAPYDVIVGFLPLALGALDPASLHELAPLAPGGLVLLAEPGPSRAWSLVQPASATLREGRAWTRALTAAGLMDAATRPVAASWPASLLLARVAPAPALTAVAPTAVALVARPADDLADAVRSGLEAHGMRVARIAPDGAPALLTGWTRRPGTVPERVVLVADGVSADWSDLLAQVGQALAGGTITVLVSNAAEADPLAAALTGVRRVMANELPDVRCRLVRVGADAAGAAADEVLRPDAEDEVAWSLVGRLAPRLRRGLARTDAPAAPGLRLAAERPGLLDSLRWTAALPELPGPGQVAIDVRAAGLNFRDVMWAMGLLPDEALLDGFAGPTIGLECAGVVAAVGEGVTAYAPGDRVMAFAPASMSTRTVTAAHAVMPMPEGMDFAAGATVPVAFLTVAYALGHLARLSQGERVLIHGGAGGVGLAAIQYAQARGAVIFATAGSDAKRSLLRRLGVDHVLDSRSLSFTDEVMRLTNGDGVDVVLNSLSGEAMERSLGLLRPFGRFLELGKRDFYANSAVGLRPFRHNVSYFGIDADQLPLRRPELAAALFAEIGAGLRDGSLRPLPHRVYDYADAVEAFRLMQSAGHIGKVVLAPGPVLPAAAAAAPAFRVRDDRTYLVTGGLGGFGLATARWLAAQGAEHLALVSRRGPADPDAAAVLASLPGAVALACDVADDAALEEMLDTIRAGMPPLGGVVHAAVAMDDALLPDLTRERFARALRPKLGGADALDRLTRQDPVELFVLHSSVTTPLGNPGQANYVAANMAMETVALRRAALGLPALAVQWGPIGDAGYLARQAGVGAALAKRLGGAHLTAAEALAALPRLLASGQPVIGFADIRWGALGSSLPLLRTPMFEEVQGGAGEPAAEVDLRELLATCTPDVARGKVVELLTEEVARITKLAAGRIEAGRPLVELGMDSLMAVELRLAVEQRFGLSLPVLALSEGATLHALAARVIKMLGGGTAPAPADAVADMVERLARFEDAPETISVEAD